MLQRISGPLVDEGRSLGNKGKFLCVLRREGFDVPDGVILDREEYRDFLEENNIAGEVSRLLRSLDQTNVEETSARLGALFDGARLGKGTRDKLRKELKEGELYAVRSSASKEDLRDFSFAGQYETYLNVSGPEAVEKAVIDCYRSLFSPVSLGYLVHHGLSAEGLAMSAVIQKMVQSELSGVCFTVDPLTGNDREMSIEIAQGQGENLVSGRVAPERYFYNWYEKKGHFPRTNRLLDEDGLKELGETFLKVQLLFGYPCDIEFALEKGRLYLLQAREITRIRHEELQDIWTTADFKDGGVAATVCTPYMWSLYEYIWEFSLRKFLLDSKILTEKDLDRKLARMFYGRGYWNLSVVKLALSRVIGYREREFDSEYGVRIAYEGDGHVTRLMSKSFAAAVRMLIAQSRILRERNLNCERYREELLEKYFRYKRMYDRDAVKDIEGTWYRLTRRMYLRSETIYFWQIYINTVHQSLYKDSLLKYVSGSEYLTLLGCIDNISHLRPFYEMWDISRQIRADGESLRFWQERSVEELTDALAAGKEPGDGGAGGRYGMDRVRRLIADYGYHSDKELDVTYPCYYEDPAPLVAQIRGMVKMGDEFSPARDRERGAAACRKILRRIRSQAGPRRYGRICAQIQKMRRMLWWREEYRDISTRFYYLIRVYTRKLAERLVEKGTLREAEDIWYTKVSALWDYLDGKISPEDLRDMAARNREYYRAYANYMSENEIGGVYGEALSDEKAANAGGQIRGLGASSGRVTGIARVIEDPSQISRLRPNDILVTRFTDTGWTPRFAALSGIVTEYGGILCHAAIVSREYGIPAIVSCHGVMDRIKDGQTITIDGSTGCVTIE